MATEASTAPEKDSILEFFVQASNKHDFSIDITLNVNGAVISGRMVSAKEYFEALSESIQDGGEVAKKLSEQLATAGEEFEKRDNAEAHFIHLKNTKIYNGDTDPTPSKGKVIWRGKLSEIDGFFLGKITNSK